MFDKTIGYLKKNFNFIILSQQDRREVGASVEGPCNDEKLIKIDLIPEVFEPFFVGVTVESW
jgi:hypothetical protein